MKKNVLIILIVLLSHSLYAQIAIGGGVTFFDEDLDVALQLNTEFALSKHISLSPSADYFLSEGFKYATYLFNLDVHVNLGNTSGFNYYPMLGGSYYTAFDGDGVFLATTGAGLSYTINKRLRVLAEAKYAIFDFEDFSGEIGFTAGFLINLVNKR